MAHEILPWKKAGLDLEFPVAAFSRRARHSSEINKIEGEGGALDADYQAVEAVAKVASLLGATGLHYGKDFVLKTIRFGEVRLDFRTKWANMRAQSVLKA